MDTETLYPMSDMAIVRQIGQQIRKIRLDKNLTQARLQELSGVYRTTIGDLERGGNCSLLVLVQLLRALERFDLLSPFFEARMPSPILYAKLQGVQRLRASEPRVKYGTKKKSENESEW